MIVISTFMGKNSLENQNSMINGSHFQKSLTYRKIGWTKFIGMREKLRLLKFYIVFLERSINIQMPTKVGRKG